MALELPFDGAGVPPDLPPGFQYLPQRFDAAAQKALLDEVLAAIDAAGTPFAHGTMPRTGARLSVAGTNLGPLGWLADQRKGNGYVRHHPETGRPWAPIPAALLALWDEVADYPAEPEACLVNYYDAKAKLALHVDWDEEATDAAVVSVSLGDDALFRLGGPRRGDPTRSMRLKSGDVVVLGGPSRRRHHGVDRIYPGVSDLVPGGGRINLTLRRVTIPRILAKPFISG